MNKGSRSILRFNLCPFLLNYDNYIVILKLEALNEDNLSNVLWIIKDHWEKSLKDHSLLIKEWSQSFILLLPMGSTSNSGAWRYSTFFKWVSIVTSWAWTYWSVVLHFAVCILATYWASFSHTRALTQVSIACLVIRTSIMNFAFSFSAGYQRISDVTSWASANGSVVAATIFSWVAFSIGATRIVSAQVIESESSTWNEWVASVSSWARANGCVILNFTVGSWSTSSFTWVYTLEKIASFKLWAVFVSGAFCVAPWIWIS